jgi:hypothetical protein
MEVKRGLSLVPWTLLVILVLALLLRLPGHFYPVVFHYDEGAEVRTALSYASGSLHPDNLGHPALNTYLVFLAEAVYYVVGRVSGKFGSAIDFLQAYETNLRGFLYVGRTVPLLAALCTIFLTYHLGRRLWSILVGLGGALLLAVSPQHIIVSNNLRPWSLGTCMATLSLLCLTRVGPTVGWQLLALAGLAVGFALASIYSLCWLLLPFVVALGSRWRGVAAVGARPQWVKDVLTAGAGIVTGFTVGNFGVLLVWREVLEALRHLLTFNTASSSIAYLTNAGWYISSLWDVFGMGPLLASLVVVALLWASWRASARQWVVLSFVWVVFLVQPLVITLWASRYTVIAYPILLLAASALMMAAWTRFTVVWPQHGWLTVPVLALLLLATPNLVTMLGYHNIVRRTPTRELARQWIETHLPSGTKIVIPLKYMGPRLPLGRASLEKKYGKYGYGRLAPSSSGPYYEVEYLQLGNVRVQDRPAVFRDKIAQLMDEGFSYLIETDLIPHAQRVRLGWKEDSLQDVLGAGYSPSLVSRFFYTDFTHIPDETAAVNPEVRIYRLLKSEASRLRQ